MGNKTTISQRAKYSQLFLIVLSVYTAIFMGYCIFRRIPVQHFR